MQFVRSPVHTIVLGQASSMASLILAGGKSSSHLYGESRGVSDEWRGM
jgi:ATP-dependent protease ClpP protease subunit